MEVEIELKHELPSAEPDKCRCCLQKGELKELWSEYMADDGVVIYGEALVECFSLALHQPEEVVEKICVTCIDKLHDAHTFKKLVMESDKKLLEQYFQGEELTMDDYEENFQSLSDENNDYSEEENSDDEKSNNAKKAPSAEELALELLEAAGSNEPINTKVSVPVRKSRAGRGIYKRYEPKHLDQCMEAVKTEAMTKCEAATFFNIPYKTVHRMSRAELKKDVPESVEITNEEKKERHKIFLKEIKTILKFTNATPYKSKAAHFSCAYCRMKFDDAVELRSHTSSVHSGERFSGVDVFMKATWLNEILKIDIVDLRCIICPAPIEEWNDMFLHLREKHKVELDEAYTRVIPYKLTAPFVCTLCDERCDSYSILDLHMNTHYVNYICGECGDSFLAESRLKKHIETHSTERFKCPFCPKFFALDKYRKKHIDGVHQHSYFYKCRYCKEEFVNENHRHKHMEKHHSNKIKPISCKFCEKTFTFRPYYLKHVRLTHRKKDPKHKCPKCSKAFKTKYDLKKHDEWHLGHHKQTCLVCNRSFASKQYLEKHYNKVHADTDVLVLETDHS